MIILFCFFLLKCIVIPLYYNVVVMKFYHLALEYVLPTYGTNMMDQVC